MAGDKVDSSDDEYTTGGPRPETDLAIGAASTVTSIKARASGNSQNGVEEEVNDQADACSEGSNTDLKGQGEESDKAAASVGDDVPAADNNDSPSGTEMSDQEAIDVLDDLWNLEAEGESVTWPTGTNQNIVRKVIDTFNAGEALTPLVSVNGASHFNMSVSAERFSIDSGEDDSTDGTAECA